MTVASNVWDRDGPERQHAQRMRYEAQTTPPPASRQDYPPPGAARRGPGRCARPALAVCLAVPDRSHLAALLGCRYDLLDVAEPEALPAAATRGDAVAALVDVSGTAPERVAMALVELRALTPSVSTIGLANVSAADAGRLLLLGRSGMDQVVFRRTDRLAERLLRLLADATRRHSADTLIADLAVATTPEGDRILRYCFQHAQQRLTVGALARGLGIHRRTLLNWAAASELPSPSSLIGWSRLLCAAQLLEDSSRSVESIAHALGYGSGSALRNAFRRYLGACPSSLRERGGATLVLGRLSDTVRHRRTTMATDATTPGRRVLQPRALP